MTNSAINPNSDYYNPNAAPLQLTDFGMGALGSSLDQEVTRLQNEQRARPMTDREKKMLAKRAKNRRIRKKAQKAMRARRRLRS